MLSSTLGAQPLTQEELFKSVLQADVQTAVFDFDGTIWPGDAGLGFMHWSIDTGLLSADTAAHILDRHGCYHRGEVDEISICGEMTQVYKGLTESAVRASAKAYFQQHIQARFFPSMLALMAALQQEGAKVWIVSSTNNWVIEEGVRDLGLQAASVLAAAVTTKDGIITQELIHVPSDEGKAEALHNVGLTVPDAVFGNSVHDLQMLQMARLPFAINPSCELAEYSTQHGWPVYYPPTV